MRLVLILFFFVFFALAPGVAGAAAWPATTAADAGAEFVIARITAAPPVSAAAWILIDPVGRQVLDSRRAFVSMPPASTTKILTCLVVLERCGLDEVVVVSRNAARTGGSRVGLRPGQRLLVRDLLYGLMLRSGNDAAVALAEHAAGSVAGFAALMNQRARELGALATRFVNPHGLPAKGHRSTAYDLALIARHALANPGFRRLVACRENAIGSLDPAWTRLIRNTNQLLWSFEGADGVKTGTTREAGQCLVASATREGRQLIAVVLRSGNRWRDCARLLGHGFDHTRLFLAGQAGDRVTAVAARDPAAPGAWPGPGAWPWRWPWAGPRRVRVDLQLGADLAFAHTSGRPPAPSLTFVTDPDLRLPVAAGEQVGTALIRDDGRIVAAAPLVAGEAAPRALALARLVAEVGGALKGLLEQGLR